MTGADSRTAVNNAMGGKTLDELRNELAAEGVSVYYARVKRHLENFFNTGYAKARRKQAKRYRFQTLKPAIRAYLKYQKAKGLSVTDAEMADPEANPREWREPIQPPPAQVRNDMAAPLEDARPGPSD